MTTTHHPTLAEKVQRGTERLRELKRTLRLDQLRMALAKARLVLSEMPASSMPSELRNATEKRLTGVARLLANLNNLDENHLQHPDLPLRTMCTYSDRQTAGFDRLMGDRRFATIGSIVAVPFPEVEARFKECGIEIDTALRLFLEAYQTLQDTTELSVITGAVGAQVTKTTS